MRTPSAPTSPGSGIYSFRSRISRALRRVVVLGAVALASTLLVVSAGGKQPTLPPGESDAGAWRGLVGEPRAEVALGQLSLVVLELPSLADRVAQAGGLVGDRQERRWTKAAQTAQRLFISRMGVQGARIRPVFSFARVLNGFSAPLDPRAIALLERAPDVEGVYPVRPAYPAAVSSRILGRADFLAGLGLRPDVGLPGFDGRGVTVALLDTGVDRAQPYLRGRVHDGIDVVDGQKLALAAPKPDNRAELEQHGTELAGIVVGGGGPGGLSGVAPGASILPIRVAGWQRDATGGWAVYSRTDQIVAGLERAVDPNDDGDSHDAARVALVGVAERFAAFADGPLARAAAGAMRLDTLVVAPAGNDGPAGPAYGSVAGPGGAPAALTVGAADLRLRTVRARVVVHAGLDVVLDRVVPLGSVVVPERPLSLEVAGPRASAPGRTTGLGLPDFFDAGGYSRVAGRAALVPAGDDTAGTVRAAARAGAAAVVVYGGSVPAGGLGVDERVPVPVISVPTAVARRLLAALADQVRTAVSIGSGEVVASVPGRSVAAFSSRGLAFDGRVKPELTAPGVGIATSQPGANGDGSARFGTVNGSSAAAAAVAGAAALLAQARPELAASALKSVLVGTARPIRETPIAAQGAGLVDVGRAAAAELAAQPATLAFGLATREGWTAERVVLVRNLSPRTLRIRVRVNRRGFPAADTIVSARPRRLILRPGATARVRVGVAVPDPTAGGPPAEGALVLAPVGGGPVRVPFAVAFAPSRPRLLAGIELSPFAFRPSDARPAVLSLEAGRVRTIGTSEEVEPVSRLDIELWTGDGKRIGVIARQRNLLPGRYTFGITGRDPGGQVLKQGDYRLRILAFPTGGGLATRRSLRFRIQ
jgi:subtilisin family serine protease